ncbi:hypothetical protein KFU94_66855 [Chloroflexi bacterium TSY]|nr:hypothetical protein [Chloroflexi bacterium TSY]
MSNIQIKQLSQTAIRLEEIFGCAVDIEWAIYNGWLYLLQCRPITAVGHHRQNKTVSHYKYIWSTVEPMWTMELGLETRARLLPDAYAAHTLWAFQDLFYAKIGSVYEYHISKQDVEQFQPTLAEIESLVDKADQFYYEQEQYFSSLARANFRQMNSGQLATFFEDAMRFYCQAIGLYSCSSALVTNHLEEKLRQVLPLDELFTSLQTVEPDVMEEEQADWRKVLQQEYSSEAILKHVRKYPYLALNLHTTEQVLSVMHDLYHQARAGFEDNWSARAGRDKTALQQMQEQILERYPALRDLVGLMHRLSLSRMRIKRGWAGIGFFLIPFFEEIARRSGESVADLMTCYCVNDIKTLLLEGRQVSATTRSSRTIGCLWHIQGDQIQLVEGQPALDLYNQKIGAQNADTLSGIVASPGTVRGTARIIHCNDIDSVQKGRSSFQEDDILVTEMAQPSMIDLISKSAAVITNEGGLLSHAAIVCRELGIPCVVDTESATKELADGQVIEIDASGEIIRVPN